MATRSPLIEGELLHDEDFDGPLAQRLGRPCSSEAVPPEHQAEAARLLREVQARFLRVPGDHAEFLERFVLWKLNGRWLEDYAATTFGLNLADYMPGGEL